MEETQARPPYVTFEKRAIEDRDASIEAGRFVAKDVIFAIVTPAGSRDKLEKVAEDWLQDLAENVRQDRFPSQWLDAYRQKFDMFLRNEEAPEDGTPIRLWPVVSPAEARNITGANVRTVEDLAAANEETIQRIGMGARALKDKAIAWMDSAGKQGKVSSELAALRTENDTLKAQNEELLARMKKVEAQIAAKTDA